MRQHNYLELLAHSPTDFSNGVKTGILGCTVTVSPFTINQSRIVLD